MKTILVFFSAVISASCNSGEGTPKGAAPKPSNEQPASTNRCYEYASPADTVSLRLSEEGSGVTGTLVYNLKEKDRNTGTIRGTMRGDILIADYTFLSEGMESVRQVAFKREGNTLVEGYGESYEQGGKFVFRNPDSLKFGSSIQLKEIACK